MSYKSELKKEYKRKQGDAFNDASFERLWKTTTQHIRRITEGKFLDTSKEAYLHLSRQGNSILDYAYEIGGVRGNKARIEEEFTKPLIIERTANFINKNGNVVIDGKRLKTWKNLYLQKKLTKEEFYDKINLFKQTNKKYLATGS